MPVPSCRVVLGQPEQPQMKNLGKYINIIFDKFRFIRQEEVLELLVQPSPSENVEL